VKGGDGYGLCGQGWKGQDAYDAEGQGEEVAV